MSKHGRVAAAAGEGRSYARRLNNMGPPLKSETRQLEDEKRMALIQMEGSVLMEELAMGFQVRLAVALFSQPCTLVVQTQA